MVSPIMRSCERLALQVINHIALKGSWKSVFNLSNKGSTLHPMLLSRLPCGIFKKQD